MATIIIFAILGFIAPTLGLNIDIKEEGSKLNKGEAIVIGLPMAILAGLLAAYGNPLSVAIVLLVLGIAQFLPIFKKDRSAMFLFSSITMATLLIVKLATSWSGITYWYVLYAVAIVFPIALAISKNIAANAAADAESGIADDDDEEPSSPVKVPIVLTVLTAAIVLFLAWLNNVDLFKKVNQDLAEVEKKNETIVAEAPAPEPAADETATPEEIALPGAQEVYAAGLEEVNLSGQKPEGASIAVISENDVEGSLTVDLNKVALYGNQYEKYSRIFSDFGEECMPTQANWDRKNADLLYAKEKKIIKETWQDAPCFMPTYVKDALTADGVNGPDTLAKYLNEHHKDDMKDSICQQVKANPVYGLMWADGLSKLELTTGKTLGDINEWMMRVIDQNEVARQVPYGQHPRGNEYWLEAYIDEAGNKKIRTTDEYDEFATKMLILIFDCFSDELGIDRYQSKIMYGLEANMDGDLIQCERLEKGEDYPGYMLKYDRKDADRELLLKINVFDLRLEICDRHQKSVAEVAKSQPAPKKVTVNPTPKKVTVNPINPIGITPNPTPTPTPPGPTPTPTPTPKKDPSQDPGNRGNAPDGSGQNDDKGPGTLQPTDPGWQPPTVTEPSNPTPSNPTPSEPSNPGGGSQDENKPDPNPTPEHGDSHDNPGNNAGEGNGEFTM